MKRAVFLIALLAFGYVYRDELMSLVYGKRHGVDPIAFSPAPKREVFDHWHDIALNLCTHEPLEKHNLSVSQCQEKVNERHSSCYIEASRNAPDIVAELDVAKQLGREYLQYVTPYYFCNGVEARTEAEIKQKCK